MTAQRRPRKRASDWAEDVRRAERSAWWTAAAMVSGFWAVMWLVVHYAARW